MNLDSHNIEAATSTPLLDGNTLITVAVITEVGYWAAYQVIVDESETDSLTVRLDVIPSQGRPLTYEGAVEAFRGEPWLWKMINNHLGVYDSCEAREYDPS